METFDRVAALLREHLLLTPDRQIYVQSKLADDLGADSLDMTELMMIFEDEFGIEIPDDDILIKNQPPAHDTFGFKLPTVGDLVAYIDGKLSALKAA